MNDIRKTIGWADLSWNPIKGVCPVGCWYCYARKIYKRFGMDEKPSLVNHHELVAPVLVTGPNKKRIFVCSTFDLFHPVADQFRDFIFALINHALLGRPDLTFIILTKIPERIDRPMPDNVWLGVSVEGAGEWGRVDELMKRDARVRFVSIEPFMGPTPMIDMDLSWVIVGRLTGHGHKNDPTRDRLLDIVRECEAANIPLFMKSNLREILGWPLIQEFPKFPAPRAAQTPAP